MRPGAGHRRAGVLLLAAALVVSACQPPPTAHRRAAPSVPQSQLNLCERPARPSPPSENAAVEASFRAFAQRWLEKRRQGTANGRRFEIRDDFEIELRPTGNAQVPYIGTLRYCEHELACAQGRQCAPSRRSAITEIFRLQDGEWQY